MMIMEKGRSVRKIRRAYANDNDALNPELWARYAVAILVSNMVAAQLVHRDFEPMIAKTGDVVNTRRPASFVVHNKVDTDDVTVQDASVTNIAVTLNQHPHVSFLIRDGEESTAMESLVDTHLIGAVKALAEHLDRLVLGQAGRFYANQAGQGALSTSNYPSIITEAGKVMDVNKAPSMGRQMIVGPEMKRLILQNATMVEADKRGDQGTALREARMGHYYGFEHYMCQNMSSVNSQDVASTAFLMAAAAAKGDTVLTIDTGTGALVVGTWVKIAGKTYRITAKNDTLGNTDQITVTPGLFADVANNEPITAYTFGEVNLGAGYAAGWSKPIVVDGFTVVPPVGSFITFTVDPTEVYCVVKQTSTTLQLDRPLKTAVADNDDICTLPPGNFGFGFQREAISLVIRPLAMPNPRAGALGFVINYQGFSIRVVITYDGTKQGHLVTIDVLCGLQVLDANLGALVLA